MRALDSIYSTWTDTFTLGENKPVAETSVDIQQIDRPGPVLQLKMATDVGLFSIVVLL